MGGKRLQELEEIPGCYKWIPKARPQQNAPVVLGMLQLVFLTVTRTFFTVSEQPREQAQKERSQRGAEKCGKREVVRIIFECLLFLSKQAMPICGHDESKTSNNGGNFIELVHFTRRYLLMLSHVMPTTEWKNSGAISNPL